MKQVLLRGITWNHSRALPPLIATAQRYEELNPGVRIQWEKRSLHEFGHADLATLAHHFDLLIIDHPMAGDAEAANILTDLLPLLSFEEIKDLRDDSLGPSFSSYLYQGKLYALPIDSAAPAASFRPDLFERNGVKEPILWSDVVALARSGLVRMPAFSADLFLNFLGLCVSRGSAVAASPEHLIDHEIGSLCLEQLDELAALMPEEIYRMNPIAIYEQMSRGDNFAYCPFAYTYSNYSRNGFGAKHVRFSNPVALEKDLPMRTVLGGTGIAISAKCNEQVLALDYSLFVAGRSCQSTLYGMCGGQPARRSAWCDPLLNQITDDFFLRTAASIETAYVRPRYKGYVNLQERAGELIAEHCKHHGNPRRAIEEIDGLYRSSLKESTKYV
ncbi:MULTISPECIES: extracellular solute-binding protein [Acidobacteriaceae]|uniref:ABC transporter substrate-binding protein n=1 Tax=Acidobacteriaceae TaxID=204434 RepID=UPI00131B96C2|nr:MULTISPECIES: extracellular solute-binding protein [Acidobacteriaceae]MDW5267066.1 extracellular solute-binding protein [Edaphobacter sp.]